jgi:hypothetical protein
VVAEIALLDDGNQGVDISRIVGTRGEAVFTADASMFIDDDDSIFPFPGCLHRAVDHAGRVVALIAEGGKKVACCVWILPFFDNLHPGAKHSQGNMVLCLAGNRTAVATDASSEIDDHRIPFLAHGIPHDPTGAQFILNRWFGLSVNLPIFRNGFPYF